MFRRQLLKTSLAMVTLAPLPTALIAGGHGRLGSFEGKSNHITTGTAEVVKGSDGNTVELLADFTFDGAPDPKVALGKDGYDASTLMGKLKSDRGASSYKIPDGIDPDEYNEVWIWCERFNVPLGVAKLG